MLGVFVHLFGWLFLFLMICVFLLKMFLFWFIGLFGREKLTCGVYVS